MARLCLADLRSFCRRGVAAKWHLTENGAVHPHRNVLTRVGHGEAVTVDRGVLQLRSVTVSCYARMACTDVCAGSASLFWRKRNSHNRRHQSHSSGEQIGGPDNITVIVADITGGDLQ